MPPRQFSADAEVQGAALLPIFQAKRIDAIMPFLQKYGLAPLDPEAWYSLRAVDACFRDIQKHRAEIDAIFDLVSIGVATGENIQLPPDVETLEQALPLWGVYYEMYSRGTARGHIITEQRADRRFRVRIRNPFPDDYAFGAALGITRRFIKHGNFRVYYENPEQRVDFGGEETVICIDWEDE